MKRKNWLCKGCCNEPPGSSNFEGLTQSSDFLFLTWYAIIRNLRCVFDLISTRVLGFEVTRVNYLITRPTASFSGAHRNKHAVDSKAASRYLTREGGHSGPFGGRRLGRPQLKGQETKSQPLHVWWEISIYILEGCS